MNIRRATPADRAELLRLVRSFADYTASILPPEQLRTRAFKDPEADFAAVELYKHLGFTPRLITFFKLL